MTDVTTSMALQLDAPEEADAQELDELTASLRRQLLQLDVEDVERPSGGEAPAGTRAVDVAAIGALVITLAKSSGALGAVVGTLQRWVSSSRARKVKLEIEGDTLEVTGLSSDDQARLITSWIERHSES